MNRFRLFTFAALALLAIVAVGCERETEREMPQPTMAVTYSTLDGSWELVALDGADIAPETYLYVTFSRSEQRFEMWDNLGSMYVNHTCGYFELSEDDYGRHIISGSYDNGVGDWNQSYEVVILYPGDEMIWRSTSTDEYSTYRRIESIPELK